MAYYNENEDEEVSPEQGFQIGGEAGSLSPGSGIPGGASSSPKGDKPGNFVGLQTYLDANKNQANQFGEKVAGGISNKINEAQTGINQFGNQFEQEARGGLIQGFDTAKDEAGQITNRAATGGLNQLPTDQDKNRFGQIVNAQYSGPKTAQESKNFNPVRQSVMEAQKLADLSANESGTQELVGQFANKNKDYTQGSNRLDSYLMNTQENKQRLSNARSGAANLQPGLAGLEPQAAQVAQKMQADTEALRNEAKKILQDTAMGKKASVNTNLEQMQLANQQKNKQIADLRNLFADDSDAGSILLDDNLINQMGLSQGQQLYGALNRDPNYYLPQEQVFDKNRAISREDQARLDALASLSSITGDKFTNPFAQRELAGTYQENPFDLSSVGKKIAEEAKVREAAYNQAYKSDLLRPSYMTNPSNPGYTPEYLENTLIPYEQQTRMEGRGNSENALRQLLEEWKNSKNYNDRVRRKG